MIEIAEQVLFEMFLKVMVVSVVGIPVSFGNSIEVEVSSTILAFDGSMV